MKHLTKLIPTAALVLMALGCQREQVVKDNPSPLYDPETKEVTTQFVLNIASAPQTKQTAEVVQQNHNFRGIQDVRLYVYNTGMSNAATVALTETPTAQNTVAPYVLNTGTPATGKVKDFELGHFMSAGSLDNTSTNNDDKSSNRILQLSIPVGSDAVLLYGKALKAANASDSDFGVTLDYDPHDPNKVSTVSTTPKDIMFCGMSILNDEQANYDATGRLMIYVINDLLSMEVGPDKVEVGGVQYNAPKLSWAQLGHQYEINAFGDDSRYGANDTNVEKMTSTTVPTYQLEGLEEVLGKCYYMFTYIKPSNFPKKDDDGNNIEPGTDGFDIDAWKKYVDTHLGEFRRLGEYRGGSSFAVKKMIIDFYKIINAAAEESKATTVKEANAQRLAGVILTKATQYFDVTTGNYKAVSTIKTLMEGKWDDSLYGGATNLNTYPFEQFGIPEGAAQLAFKPQSASQSEDAFYYLDPNYPLVNPLMDSFQPRKYLYPAELWYYVNSPIRVTNEDVPIADYPDGVSVWKDENSWKTDNWIPNGAVASATRAVAVTNSINYGVALLESNLTVTASTLLDNRQALTDENSDRSIPLSSCKISLRGILVGGVNPRMNWQFTRFYTTSGTPGTGDKDLSKFDGVIYDHSTGDPYISQPGGIKNYTLVFDNYNSSDGGDAAAQDDVYVSLEFVNGGDPFWGRDNLIPTGGVFYLVGKLEKPNPGLVTNLGWPTDHQIPPVYGVNNEAVPSGHFKGESKRIPRVFIQDFKTIANFKIDANSLKHAYYSVPDLRASQMSLGLSVDLQWQTGITYNNITL